MPDDIAVLRGKRFRGLFAINPHLKIGADKIVIAQRPGVIDQQSPVAVNLHLPGPADSRVEGQFKPHRVPLIAHDRLGIEIHRVLAVELNFWRPLRLIQGRGL